MLGRAATAPPLLLADRRKCIVYCRGIPYGERLHASRESAPWQRRNAQHGVHSTSRPPRRVCLSFCPLMPWCTPSTTSRTNRSTIATSRGSRVDKNFKGHFCGTVVSTAGFLPIFRSIFFACILNI